MRQQTILPIVPNDSTFERSSGQPPGVPAMSPGVSSPIVSTSSSPPAFPQNTESSPNSVPQITEVPPSGQPEYSTVAP